MRNAICCLCGAPRRPKQAPLASFSNDSRVVHMKEHRDVLRDPEIEMDPQLLVNVSLYRNGGVDTAGRTHMCDDCVLVGLRHAKQFIDQSIAALTAPPEPTKMGGGLPVGILAQGNWHPGDDT